MYRITFVMLRATKVVVAYCDKELYIILDYITSCGGTVVDVQPINC